MSKRTDIGTVFGDPSLNENYVEAESGEIKPLYTYKEDKGNIYIRCEICNLTALGKHNLDTHIAGKKHRTALKKFEMSGKEKKLYFHVKKTRQIAVIKNKLLH